MNIIIQPELKTYLEEHNHDTITLKLVHNDYSTGNINTKNPEIRYHPPHDLEEFNTFEVEGIKLFIAKNVIAQNDNLEFIVEKLLGVHACHVKGLNLDQLTTM